MVGTEALTFPQTPSPSKSPSARPSASVLRSPGNCGQQRRGVRTLASALAFEDGGVAQDGREAGVSEGGREEVVGGRPSSAPEEGTDGRESRARRERPRHLPWARGRTPNRTAPPSTQWRCERRSERAPCLRGSSLQELLSQPEYLGMCDIIP